MKLIAGFILFLILCESVCAQATSLVRQRSERQVELGALYGLGFDRPFDSRYSDSPTMEVELTNWVNENLPGVSTCAVNTLVEMVRSRVSNIQTNNTASEAVWMQNSGVVAYYQNQLRDSPCLATLIGEFYRSQELKQSHAYSSENDLLPNSEGRASLASFAGTGSFQSIQPGHYYELANQVAEGDPVLAMEILGYCGHDDANQNLNDSTSFSNHESSETIRGFIRRRASIPNENSANDLSTNVDRIVNGSFYQLIQDGGSVRTQIECPARGSNFYAPGAIHPDIALDQETIDTIARVQAPTQGANVLPAKAYHGTFAAVMGCKLASCGLSPEMSGKIMSGFALTYRRVRMRETTDSYILLALLIQEKFGVEFYKSNDNEQVMSEEFGKKVMEWLHDSSNRKEISDAIGGQEIFVANQARLSWNRMRRNMDAANLYQWSGYGHVRSYLRGDWEKSKQEYIDNPNLCTMGEERCDEAMNTLETWMTDFKWSQEQQMRGASFGAKECAENNQSINNEQRACHALNQKHQSITPCPTLSIQ
jgi:hypothetical protein